MMNSKQLVSASVIATLILSNAIIGEQYVKDTKYYESKIHSQSKVIKRYKDVDTKNNLIIKQQSDELKQKDVDINNLNNQLNELKKEWESRKEVVFEVTAYTAGIESTGKTSSSNGYKLTASGVKVQDGVTVACPPEYPFGTKLNIENVGIRICQDRGSAIKNNVLDLYIESLSKAKEFGRQTLKVTILN